ncbi:hypothetical protein [uncultured Phascolarctobacterium sp.]|uniref:hypothetical protein n=1 Tax=uncultured Phascolarctobacterium sp. TaxID=512296 RepID=UPI002604B894|nr:hypothetical protein [uncultured Phascolarctobacterium sp.]
MKVISCYALKIVFYLLIKKKYVTYRELNAVLRVPMLYTVMIINKLAGLGIVKKADFVSGGVRWNVLEEMPTLQELQSIIMIFEDE